MERQSVNRVFKIPALRSLGDLAGSEPVIIIDHSRAGSVAVFQAEDAEAAPWLLAITQWQGWKICSRLNVNRSPTWSDVA
jgi:hypothetical protein